MTMVVYRRYYTGIVVVPSTTLEKSKTTLLVEFCHRFLVYRNSPIRRVVVGRGPREETYSSNTGGDFRRSSTLASSTTRPSFQQEQETTLDFDLLVGCLVVCYHHSQ